ncbi:hypothetical protein F5884DRAFT_781106 [Xylogone sp. PMI_703]|nr:hypothetical protein F5884DRAFT_781106 [Xylogone sp. PMI_703]
MGLLEASITGTHVLVTGGTKGIGRFIVQAFLAAGANVSYCARSVTGEEFTKFEGKAPDSKAVGAVVDISDPASIEEWVNKAHSQFGRIDHIIANASPILGANTPESWELSFRADIMGLRALIEAGSPYLEAQAQSTRNASITVISSLAGFERRHPSIGSPYSTFKRAQAVIAKDYVRKLGPKNVRINVIIPGSIENPGIVLPDGTKELSSYEIVKRDNYPFYKALLDATSLERTGKPEEVANSVLFLSSSLASYVTGANLIVDGGMSQFF